MLNVKVYLDIKAKVQNIFCLRQVSDAGLQENVFKCGYNNNNMQVLYCLRNKIMNDCNIIYYSFVRFKL